MKLQGKFWLSEEPILSYALEATANHTLHTWVASHFKLNLPPPLGTASSKWIHRVWNFFFFERKRLPKPIWLWLWATKNWRKKKNPKTIKKVTGNDTFRVLLKDLMGCDHKSDEGEQRASAFREKIQTFQTARAPRFPLWGARLCTAEMLSFTSNRWLSQVGPPLEAQWDRAFQKSHCGNRSSEGATPELQRGGCVLWGTRLDFRTGLLCSWRRAFPLPR